MKQCELWNVLKNEDEHRLLDSADTKYDALITYVPSQFDADAASDEGGQQESEDCNTQHRPDDRISRVGDAWYESSDGLLVYLLTRQQRRNSTNEHNRKQCQ